MSQPDVGGGPGPLRYYQITDPAGLIVVQPSDGPMSAIVYRPDRDSTWRYNPVLAAKLLYDPREDYRTELVDRATAESWSRDDLGRPLPDEVELRRLLAAGDAEANTRRWPRSLLRRYGRVTTTLGESTDVVRYPEGAETTFYAIYRVGEPSRPAGLIAVEPWRSPAPMRAVTWEPGRDSWLFDPDRSRDFLLNPHTADLKEVLSRETAERYARELGTTLPDDDQIHHVCEEGLRSRHRAG